MHNNDEAERPDPNNYLRRQMDQIFAERLTAISTNMDRFRDAAEKAIRESAKTQAQQALLIARITALNNRFLEHDEREGDDRVRIINTMERITETLGGQGAEIKANSEAIGTLKQWSWLLAGAIGALAASGVGWIIQHLQATVGR
ncbi:MAG: hypothetical protein P9F75_00740 [Candidatus Contendobacter sp.]|nr:hypothetical protein [Candidatus Contendobacter sp.]